MSHEAGATANETTDLYKVCYRNDANKARVSIVAMSDGGVLTMLDSFGDTHEEALKAMCDTLNQDSVAEFRLATMSETITYLQTQTNRFADGQLLELSMSAK